MLRVKIERPRTLQEAMNLAKRNEREIELQSGLVRKNAEIKTETPNTNENVSEKKNAQNRFHPYKGRGRARNFAAKSTWGNNNEKKNSQDSTETKADKRCYSCNKFTHMARNCRTNKEKRACLNCNKVGHIAKNCRSNKSVDNKEKNKVICDYCKIPGHTLEKCYKRLNKIAKSQEEKEQDLNEK